MLRLCIYFSFVSAWDFHIPPSNSAGEQRVHLLKKEVPFLAADNDRIAVTAKVSNGFGGPEVPDALDGKYFSIRPDDALWLHVACGVKVGCDADIYFFHSGTPPLFQVEIIFLKEISYRYNRTFVLFGQVKSRTWNGPHDFVNPILHMDRALYNPQVKHLTCGLFLSSPNFYMINLWERKYRVCGNTAPPASRKVEICSPGGPCL